MPERAVPVSPDKKLAAVCGLFCPACSLFIGSMEDPARLQATAERLGLPVERLECHGCRSDTRGFFCNDHCKMTDCAAERGLGFCGECSDYPCEELTAFQAQMPHRSELWESQERIIDAGYKQWYAEMTEHYSCPECRTLNSAYDISCRTCGTTPSCAFVRLHKDEIVQSVKRIGPKEQ